MPKTMVTQMLQRREAPSGTVSRRIRLKKEVALIAGGAMRAEDDRRVRQV